ncbi:hypothetical protein L195_g040287, partial [Trifolium pratense]
LIGGGAMSGSCPPHLLNPDRRQSFRGGFGGLIFDLFCLHRLPPRGEIGWYIGFVNPKMFGSLNPSVEICRSQGFRTALVWGLLARGSGSVLAVGPFAKF